jgi:RNA polymerase sigma-70 factor (ECF subfamily)
MVNAADRIYLQVQVVRAQLGDREAFSELVAHCQPRLRAFLQKMLPEPTHVDDLMQDVWMDVFRNLAHLLDPAAFMPWLYRIAHNRCAKSLRRRPQPMASGHDIENTPAIENDVHFTAEDAQAVHAGLSRLTIEHREVLLLRFLEDMAYEDISCVVGCPVGTVRSRIYNAKAALRRILETARTS